MTRAAASQRGIRALLVAGVATVAALVSAM